MAGKQHTSVETQESFKMRRIMKQLIMRIVIILVLCCLTNAMTAATFGLFTYTDNGTSITITGYSHEALGAVEIPTTIDGKPVVSIGDKAFADCFELTKITIPTSVTSIGNKAFFSCYHLTSVTIPASVTRLGEGVFMDCTGLTSITIPNSVTSIGNLTFFHCTGLINITMPSSVTSIGELAFISCTGLTSVTIPASVTSIGRMAFADCLGLTSASFIGNASSMGENVFFGKTTTDFTVHYLDGKTGFTSPMWHGYSAKAGAAPP